MLELILFPIIFTIIAIVTKKDVAIVVAAANWLAVLADMSSITHEGLYVLYALLTAGIAAHAESQADHGHKLAHGVAIVCLLSLMVQLLALVSYHPVIPHIATGLQLAAAIVLIRYDGRRELLRDMANDISDCFRSMAGAARRANRHKGH